MSQLALALACAVTMLAACAEGGQVAVFQWTNPDCSGTAAEMPKYGGVPLYVGEHSSDATCLQSTGQSVVPYGKYICSDDGTKVSVPAYSDANCADEIDMNSPAWCSRVFWDSPHMNCTFPPHMTFVSGKCTQVAHAHGFTVFFWSVTISDCEASWSYEWHQGGGWVVFVVFVSVGVLFVCCSDLVAGRGCCNRACALAGRPPNSSNVRCSPPSVP
jgi:hypothetical protein